MAEDTRKYNADQYNITPDQVGLFIEKVAASKSMKKDFMICAIAELLNDNKKSDADNLKEFINVLTWEEVIKGEK